MKHRAPLLPVRLLLVFLMLAPVTAQARVVRVVIEALDVRGRWVEHGTLRDPENREKRIETRVISCRTFNRNLTLLARYVKGNN